MNCSKMETLSRMAKRWGGSIEQVRIGDYRRLLVRKDFHKNPFSKNKLGILWEEKRILYCGKVSWPEVAEKVFNSLQREKLYENWEVRAMTKPGMTPYLVEFYATKKAAVTRRRKEADRVNPPSGLHIVHVVRYKRKRA